MLHWMVHENMFSPRVHLDMCIFGHRAEHGQWGHTSHIVDESMTRTEGGRKTESNKLQSQNAPNAI
jgi:hypothetical protein